MSRHEYDQSPPINLKSCFSLAVTKLFLAVCSTEAAPPLSITVFYACPSSNSIFLSNSSCSPHSSHQHVPQAPINQRGHQGASAPACRAPTCSTPPSLAAPPSLTASASPAISQQARPARVSGTDQLCDIRAEHRRRLLTAKAG